MEKTFYIFRHGETFATKGGTGYGVRILTAPILAEATPALERLGEYLKDIPTDFNVSSKIKRCRQTVEIISKKSGKEFVFDKRLNEYFLESFKSVQERLTSLLQEIDEKGCKNILICTHGAIIGALLGFFTDQKFEEQDIFNYPPPGVLTIIEGTRIQQINFNQT